ncbi:SpoIVB peptidase [Lachnospiraceae bacterium ZAX-1]
MRVIKLKKWGRWFFAIGFVLLGLFFARSLEQSIPDEIRIVAGREETFDLKVPVTGVLTDERLEVFGNQTQALDRSSIHVDMNDTFTLKSSEQGSFSIVCKLFGFISLKKVAVEVVDEERVVPCGVPIGIYVQTDGVLIIGTGTITGFDGMNYEPAYHIVKSGDYIKTVNEEVIKTKEDLIRKTNAYGAQSIVLGIIREGEFIQIKVDPVKTGDEEYKLGIWVRDDLAGVGTMTFYTENMQYGALGHAVSDVDTSTMITMGDGLLYETSIVGITKGEKGKPGEISGIINYQEEDCLGDVLYNSSVGIYGHLDKLPRLLDEVAYAQVGLKQEIELGPAMIVSSVSGERKEYAILITGIDYGSENENKGILFEVTDDDLLSLTGGIVQGMSGSPILQHHKMIGAVTHVFIKDATKGYGIFIENMLAQLDYAKTK